MSIYAHEKDEQDRFACGFSGSVLREIVHRRLLGIRESHILDMEILSLLDERQKSAALNTTYLTDLLIVQKLLHDLVHFSSEN